MAGAFKIKKKKREREGKDIGIYRGTLVVMSQGEDRHPKAKKRGIIRNQPCGLHGLRLRPSRPMRK